MTEDTDGGPRDSADSSNVTADGGEDKPHVNEADPFDSFPEIDGADPFEQLDIGSDLGNRTPAEEARLFEAVDVGSDVSEAPWEELVSGEDVFDGGVEADEEDVFDGGNGLDEIGEVDATSVEPTVVSKRRYCQQCEYFTAPPDVACTHSTGEILEVADIEHFRVHNCPVVAYRREHSAYDASELEADD